MKRGKKIAILVAVILVALGAVLAIGAALLGDIQAEDVNTMEVVTETFPVEKSFTHIDLEDVVCNVYLQPAEDGQCKVVCQRPASMTYTVAVEEDTLIIRGEDDSKWYDNIQIGPGWGELAITLCLPETQYGSLTLETVAGDLEIPANFTFDRADLSTVSGEINFQAGVQGNLTAQSVSGDVTIQTVRPDTLRAETVSGDLNLSDVGCLTLTAEGVSGNISCRNVTAEGAITMETTSGDIELDGCDGASLVLASTSGNITGSLLTAKIFLTDTESGNVQVPQSAAGGTCEITTTSGDILFSEPSAQGFGGTSGKNA